MMEMVHILTGITGTFIREFIRTGYGPTTVIETPCGKYFAPSWEFEQANTDNRKNQISEADTLAKKNTMAVSALDLTCTTTVEKVESTEYPFNGMYLVAYGTDDLGRKVKVHIRKIEVLDEQPQK